MKAWAFLNHWGPGLAPQSLRICMQQLKTKRKTCKDYSQILSYATHAGVPDFRSTTLRPANTRRLRGRVGRLVVRLQFNSERTLVKKKRYTPGITKPSVYISITFSIDAIDS